MYGFQPKHARGKPAQALADGGLVHSITGMLGMRKRTPEEMLAADAKVQERNREAAARVAARANPAQQAAPAEEKAVSSYAGMSAMQRREKELGLKDGGIVGGFKPGGLIRGPGTGTSDSIETEKRPGTFIMPADSTQAITPEVLARLGATEEMPEGAELGEDGQGEGGKVPVRLSNGEFELPPEQVQALGEAVLTVLRDATHQPASGQEAPTGKGFTPHQFFADGGTVQDEEERASKGNPAGIGFADGGRVRPRGFVVGPGTETSDSIPARLSKGEYVLPADTVRAVGVDKLDALREATHDPAQGRSGKNGPEFFFAGGTPEGVDGVKKAYDDWQASKPSWFAQQTPTSVQKERDAEAAYGKALQDSYRTNLNGGQPGSALLTQPAAQQDGKAPEPPVAPAAPSAAGAGRGTVNPSTVNPSAPAPSNAPAAAPEVMPGVYRHGRGQYSDNASGMGMPAGFTGQPNAQNMAAADALQARQTPAGFQPAGSQPAGVQAPVVRNSTNDWAARKALENAATAASSITANGGRFDRNGRAGSPQAAAYRAALANDFALQQAQPGMDQAAMRENAGIQREGMQQDGATTRTGMTEQGSNAREAGRNALAQGELGLKREAAGLQTRAAQRRESAYDNYSKAKTDEDRQAIAKQFPDLFGQAKDAAHRMEVVRGKTDPMTGQSSGDYVVVQDPKTGEVRQIQMGAQQPALPPGMKRQIGTSNGRPVYEDMNGKQVIAKG